MPKQAPWPRAQDVSLAADGGLRLRKGKHELVLTDDEVSGLFDLLMLRLPDGPRREQAKRYRRYRLAHEAALMMASRVADLAHQTLQLLDHARAIDEPVPISQPPDSSPRPTTDDQSQEGFVPQVRAR